MHSSAATPARYIASLPEGQRKAVAALRKILRQNLPDGFAETMGHGMIAYVVPHSLYPAGYHADPASPLPFISLAGQKGYIALYHMGIYGDAALSAWFRKEYGARVPTRLDMGKSCIRFRDPDGIPFDLIAELARKIGAGEWIERYEAALKRR